MKDLFMSGTANRNIRKIRCLSLAMIFSVVLAVLTCLPESGFCQAQDLTAQFTYAPTRDLNVAFADQSIPTIYWYIGT